MDLGPDKKIFKKNKQLYWGFVITKFANHLEQ